MRNRSCQLRTRGTAARVYPARGRFEPSRRPCGLQITNTTRRAGETSPRPDNREDYRFVERPRPKAPLRGVRLLRKASGRRRDVSAVRRTWPRIVRGVRMAAMVRKSGFPEEVLFGAEEASGSFPRVRGRAAPVILRILGLKRLYRQGWLKRGPCPRSGANPWRTTASAPPSLRCWPRADPPSKTRTGQVLPHGPGP
jgi:hypothetical protein